MAKKPTITAGFTTKSNFQSLPGVPVSQKLDSQLEWNPSIQSIVESITENYERLVLKWTTDVSPNQDIALGQYADFFDEIYRCKTAYNVGPGGIFNSANFSKISGGGGVAIVDGIGTKFNVDKIDLNSDSAIPNDIEWVLVNGDFNYGSLLTNGESGNYVQNFITKIRNEFIARGDITYQRSIDNENLIGAAVYTTPLGEVIISSSLNNYKFIGFKFERDYPDIDWTNNELLIPHQKQVRNLWLNTPIPFTPTFALNEKQEFQDYTLSANETWNASSVKGGFAIFDLITDGTVTVSEGSGFYVDHNNFFGNVLPADTYRVQMIATSKGVDIQVVSTGGASDTTYIPYNIPNIIP